MNHTAKQGRAALFVVFTARQFVQCPLQHQKIHRRLTLLDIFCVAAAVAVATSYSRKHRDFARFYDRKSTVIYVDGMRRFVDKIQSL